MLAANGSQKRGEKRYSILKGGISEQMEETDRSTGLATFAALFALCNALVMGCSDEGRTDECSYSKPYNQDWPTGNTFVEISCHYKYCCALDRSGTIDCWGFDFFDCTTCSPSDNDFIKVSAGSLHTCGLHENGSIECWGCDDPDRSTDYGQCDAPSDTDFTEVSTGTNYSHLTGRF